MSLHLGQAGVGTGLAMWDTLCHNSGQQGGGVFFNETPQGDLLPRAVFGDLDAESLGPGVQKIRMWGRSTFHYGKEDAASNYSRGRFDLAYKYSMLPSLQEGLRATLETCSSPQGLLTTCSLAGGGGSALASLVLEQETFFSDHFAKKPRVSLALLPSPRFSTSVVEPYNTSWALYDQEEHTDLFLHCDNQALYSMALAQGQPDPFLPHLNALLADSLAPVLEALTSSSSLSSLTTNLVPSPSLKHTMASHRSPGSHQWTQLLTNTRKNELVLPAGKEGEAMASSVFTSQLWQQRLWMVEEARKTRSGISLTSCCKRPQVQPLQEELAMTNIYNSTSFAGNLHMINQQFDKLFQKRAFVHWYEGIGIESSTWDYIRNRMQDLEENYLKGNV